jgi:hypothetical protein
MRVINQMPNSAKISPPFPVRPRLEWRRADEGRVPAEGFRLQQKILDSAFPRPNLQPLFRLVYPMVLLGYRRRDAMAKSPPAEHTNAPSNFYVGGVASGRHRYAGKESTKPLVDRSIQSV